MKDGRGRLCLRMALMGEYCRMGRQENIQRGKEDHGKGMENNGNGDEDNEG